MRTIKDVVASILVVALIAGCVTMFKIIGAIAGTIISIVLAVLAVYLFIHHENAEPTEPTE